MFEPNPLSEQLAESHEDIKALVDALESVKAINEVLRKEVARNQTAMAAMVGQLNTYRLSNRVPIAA